MRALQLIEDRKLEVTDVAPPPEPAAGEVTLRIRAVALNHIDVWGWRGMAFAKRKLPLVIGAEPPAKLKPLVRAFPVCCQDSWSPFMVPAPAACASRAVRDATIFVNMSPVCMVSILTVLPRN